MGSPKVLMEAGQLDRSAQTLDHQLNGAEKSRRMNNGQGAHCHTCQATGHSKEQCTVSKDKLYFKNCKKKGLHNTNNYCRRQLDKAKKNKNEKKEERSNSTERKKSNTAKKSSDRDPTPVRTTEDDDLGDSGNRTCLLNPESEDEEDLEVTT